MRKKDKKKNIVHPIKIILALGFTTDAVHLVGFDNCITTCVQYHSVVLSSFTALKILCAPPIHPSLPAHFWQPAFHSPAALLKNNW